MQIYPSLQGSQITTENKTIDFELIARGAQQKFLQKT
jgi:hypothetical protein